MAVAQSVERLRLSYSPQLCDLVAALTLHHHPHHPHHQHTHQQQHHHYPEQHQHQQHLGGANGCGGGTGGAEGEPQQAHGQQGQGQAHYRRCTLADVLTLVSARVLEHSVELQAQNDALREAVRAQAEHGRIARLLIKLGCVNERPEFEGDPAWSETGDRYLLKLLRDVLFHQVDADGAPLVNYAHIVRGAAAAAAASCC
jgi:hypothetical protein